MANKYYIKENFYFDFDHLNQIRIAGPGNHLLLGWTFAKDIKVEIKNYFIDGKQLVINLELPVTNLKIHVPVVTDIRTIRNVTESTRPRSTYQTLIENSNLDLLPKTITIEKGDDFNIINLKNLYKDRNNKKREYGIKIFVPTVVNFKFKNNFIEFKSKSTQNIHLKIRTINNLDANTFNLSLFNPKEHFSPAIFSQYSLRLYDETYTQIEHLIKYNKTSSFEYGTVFPRDWMESADLGYDEFTKQTIDHMYSRALEHVADDGEGWHENVIGQYRSKIQSAHQDIIDRKMIDIEPHYLLGLKYVSPQFILDPTNAYKLKKIATYIVKKATDNEYITFKNQKSNEEYYKVGNWRDSEMAYPRQESPLAPFDVNCVFYPQSLKVIKDYNALFGFDEDELIKLIEKWDAHKDRYRIYHPDNILGSSIALHGRKNKPMPIAHLDESYDMFYGQPSFHEVDSFARKIVNPNYFYTPAGPLLVASDEKDFTTHNYHGKVIWPKQTAFAVGGLTIQYKKAMSENWPIEIIKQIKNAIIITSEASFKAWAELNGVPELYYYDAELQKARLYTDQEEYDAQMSYIQLWSSVAVRRITTDYNFIVNE